MTTDTHIRNDLRRSWTELKTEAAKLKAEAEVRGGEIKEQGTKLFDDVSSRADEALSKLDAAAEAGAEKSRDAFDHIKSGYEATKTKISELWSKIR